MLRASSKLISTWLAVTIAASIIAALDDGWLASWAALSPARIWRGEIWRLATWALVEIGPMSLVLTCVAIYKFGGDLAVRWSTAGCAGSSGRSSSWPASRRRCSRS